MDPVWTQPRTSFVSVPSPCGRLAPSAGPRQVPVLSQPANRRPRTSAEEEEGFTPRDLFKNMREAVCGGGVLKGVLNGGRAAQGFKDAVRGVLRVGVLGGPIA